MKSRSKRGVFDGPVSAALRIASAEEHPEVGRFVGMAGKLAPDPVSYLGQHYAGELCAAPRLTVKLSGLERIAHQIALSNLQGIDAAANQAFP